MLGYCRSRCQHSKPDSSTSQKLQPVQCMCDWYNYWKCLGCTGRWDCMQLTASQVYLSILTNLDCFTIQRWTPRSDLRIVRYTVSPEIMIYWLYSVAVSVFYSPIMASIAELASAVPASGGGKFTHASTAKSYVDSVQFTTGQQSQLALDTVESAAGLLAGWMVLRGHLLWHQTVPCAATWSYTHTNSTIPALQSNNGMFLSLIWQYRGRVVLLSCLLNVHCHGSAD